MLARTRDRRDAAAAAATTAASARTPSYPLTLPLPLPSSSSSLLLRALRAAAAPAAAALAARASAASAARRHASAKAAGVTSRMAAILGAQWGDEGKGKLADVLAKNYDLVCRFNGGANAGHTVVVGGKKYAFHLLPCGVIHAHTTNLLGNGTVVHADSLFKELAELEGAGVPWQGRVLVSDRAHILFDFHREVDGLAEERRAREGGGGKIGTTKQGIGPCYASKAQRNGVRFGALKHRGAFRAALTRLVEDTQLQYGHKIDLQAQLDKWDALATRLAPMVVDGVQLVNGALQGGKRVLAEGANAALLDVDFGTYPYVTSSSTSAGGIATGLGIAPGRIESVVGVVKAYTTRVGGGPFPTELTDARGGGDRPLNAPGTDTGLHLQVKGGEVGVTTGRKRRCGWLDTVVLRYAHMLNGFSSLNVTKLDVLDELKEIKIGVGYKVNGVALAPGQMPSALEDLAAVEVQYETLKGWGVSTAGTRKFADLPPAARAYVRRVEQLVGVPVSWVGTGPGRLEMVTRGFEFDAGTV